MWHFENFTQQGLRRVLKSGPAEEIIECRRHERGEHERGIPLSLGGVRGLPRENFEFLALLCAFLMGFYAFGTKFQSQFFAKKDISWRVRKPNAKQNRFQIVTIFFTFFFSIFLRHSRRFWQSTFSTDPWLSWADPEGEQGVRTTPPPL